MADGCDGDGADLVLRSGLWRAASVETVKVSSRGRIVIPKRLREAHGIGSGDQLTVSSVGDELRLKPLSAVAPTTLGEVAGMLHRPGMKRVSDDEIEARIGRQLLAEDEATKFRR